MEIKMKSSNRRRRCRIIGERNGGVTLDDG